MSELIYQASKRDLFLKEVFRWIIEVERSHQSVGWPKYDNAGSAEGFIKNAFRVPEEGLPDDTNAAADQFIGYGLYANKQYWPDETREAKRPSWLPEEWEWAF